MKTKATTYMVIGVILGILFGSVVGVIARADSFGNDSEPDPVDYSPFFNAFKEHTDWILEYKLNENSSWTDGNSFLTIEKTWIPEFGFWKFNIIIDNPLNRSIYSARFTFGVDLPVLDYVEKVDSYIYYLNYSGFSAFFDWSDMMGIPNIVFTHGIFENQFWFRFARDNIPALYHGEFDPWFGNQDTQVTHETAMNTIVGSPYLFVVNCSGDYFYANNITARLRSNHVFNYSFAIYDNITGIIVAQTECGFLPDTSLVYSWYTLNFTSNVTLVNNTMYKLCVHADYEEGKAVQIGCNDTGGFYNTYSSLVEFIDCDTRDTAPTTQHQYNRTTNIYCSYTCYNDTIPDTNVTIDAEGCYCFSLAPSLLGFILIFLFFCFAEKKEDVLLYFLTSFISVVMGVYYLILLDGVSFTSWIGVILVLFAVYTSFMGLAYSLKHKKQR